MNHKELFEKYRLLITENNRLTEENKKLKAGRFFEGTIEEHLKRVADV